jgi:hypothetical protein
MRKPQRKTPRSPVTRRELEEFLHFLHLKSYYVELKQKDLDDYLEQAKTAPSLGGFFAFACRKDSLLVQLVGLSSEIIMDFWQNGKELIAAAGDE